MRWNGRTVLSVAFGVAQSGVVNDVQSGFISAFVLFSVISAVCHAVSVDFLYCTLTDVASVGIFESVNDGY